MPNSTNPDPSLDQIWSKVMQAHPEANALQSPAWGRVHKLLGRKVIVEHFGTEAWCQMIVRNAKRGRYLEIPCGPLLDWNDAPLVRRMFAVIKKIAKAEKCVFVRLRPQLRTSENSKLDGLGLVNAPMHLAAEHTVILDLAKSEDELLKDMRRQTRYEVRRALKLGIEVTSSNSKALFEEFHSVQAETASRQHFIPPQLKTLLAEREAFGKDALIYVARTPKTDPASQSSRTTPASKAAPTSTSKTTSISNPISDSTHASKAPQSFKASQPSSTPSDQPIAYGLVLISDNEAEYFEAASTELNHRLPGAYALEWQVIRDLKKRGVKRYNLWGIAPPNQPNHRYAGVTTFKTGFGGEVVEYVPAKDLVIKRFRYGLDWLFEMIRKKKRHL